MTAVARGTDLPSSLATSCELARKELMYGRTSRLIYGLLGKSISGLGHDTLRSHRAKNARNQEAMTATPCTSARPSLPGANADV